MWGKHFRRPKTKALEGSHPGTEWSLLRIRRARLPIWLLPLLILAIPLVLLLALILFLLFFLASIALRLAFLKPSLRSKRTPEDKTIEAEYWIEREDGDCQR